MKVISVDLGATSGRVMTVSHENHRFSYEENARFANRVYQDEAGVLRWDFSYLLKNVIEGIQKALEKNPDIVSIGIDTWAVDYGFLKEGKLVQDPACYRDKRTFASQKEVLDKIPFPKIYSLCGIQNLHFNTIYQLASEKRDWNEVDTFLMIPDLIAYFLTGEARLEETNASTTSLYLRDEKRLSKDLLDAIHVPERIFPKTILPGEKYGNLKKEFLPKNISHEVAVLAVATHDTGSAVLGANGQGEFAYLSSGTWSLIGTELNHPIINEESREDNFTNEIGYHSTIRFLKNTMGMFLINEVRNDYKERGNEIKVSEIAPLVKEASEVDCFLDINNPLFETPGKMLSKIEKYCRETSQAVPSTPGEMMKVIYRSMALSYRNLMEKLMKLTGVHFSSLLVVGGGNQASVLNQYTADACGLEVITGSSEATVLGNSLAQFLALREVASVQEGRKDISASIESQRYLPSQKAFWDREYGKFLSRVGIKQ